MTGTGYPSGAAVGQPFKRTRRGHSSRVSLTGLEQAANENPSGGGLDTSVDPIGLALKARTQEHYGQEARDIQEGPQDQWSTMSQIQNTHNAQGIMAPWFQAAEEAGVHNIRGGPSAAGSSQITGVDVQPGQRQLSTFGNPAGSTQGAAIQSARDVAQGGQLPEGIENTLPSTQDMFRRRLQQARPSVRGLRGSL